MYKSYTLCASKTVAAGANSHMSLHLWLAACMQTATYTGCKGVRNVDVLQVPPPHPSMILAHPPTLTHTHTSIGPHWNP